MASGTPGLQFFLYVTLNPFTASCTCIGVYQYHDLLACEQTLGLTPHKRQLLNSSFCPGQEKSSWALSSFLDHVDRLGHRRARKKSHIFRAHLAP